MGKFTTPEEGDAPVAPAKPAVKPVAKSGKAAPAPAAKPAEGEVDLEAEQAATGPEAKPGEEVAKPPEGKPGRESPWRVVESYKKKNVSLEREIAELRTAQKPGELPKEHLERFTSLENRNKELEDEIRHVNYTKSKDYLDTYQKPYEEAWTRAISELKELVITNEDGTTRQASVQDMLALANMPLGQARAMAKQWFGDSADDVMSHRRSIKELSDKQQKALEDARKNGGEREQQQNLERQAKAKARAEDTGKAWAAVNAEAVEKYDFLRPAEGQTERNEKLEKAVKFVDDTFAMNVDQAKTQEERAQIIKRHAALRNRAIGFSVLKHENASLRSELEAMKQSLAEFQGSEPTAGEHRDRQNGEAAADTLDGAVAGMARYAT
jgi:hypothetical protein